jgi:acetyl esterase/lipase
MNIDPLTVFEQNEISSAHRLNRILALLPRYHTGRRYNARMLNAVTRIGQKLAPKMPSKDVALTVFQISVPSGQREIRLLRPPAQSSAIFLHFHGGAWVLGNARLDDRWNASIAAKADVTVAAADFHLATDDRLDQTIDDAVAVTEWILDHLDEFGATKLFVGGESSGAHLAACSLVRLAARRPMNGLCGFLSFCGAFDMEGSQSLKQADGRSLILHAPSADRNLDRLTATLPDGAAHSPEVSPYLADLTGMPPALLIGGALDPIKDDSRKMYDRWAGCNGNAAILIVPEAPHGFERLPTRLADKALTFACDWMKSVTETSANAIE